MYDVRIFAATLDGLAGVSIVAGAAARWATEIAPRCWLDNNHKPILHIGQQQITFTSDSPEGPTWVVSVLCWAYLRPEGTE